MLNTIFNTIDSFLIKSNTGVSSYDIYEIIYSIQDIVGDSQYLFEHYLRNNNEIGLIDKTNSYNSVYYLTYNKKTPVINSSHDFETTTLSSLVDGVYCFDSECQGTLHFDNRFRNIAHEEHSYTDNFVCVYDTNKILVWAESFENETLGGRRRYHSSHLTEIENRHPTVDFKIFNVRVM